MFANFVVIVIWILIHRPGREPNLRKSPCWITFRQGPFLFWHTGAMRWIFHARGLQVKTKKLGLWDGHFPFKFLKIIHTPGKKPFCIRDFFVLNELAPSLNLSMDNDELQLLVKPDQKVSLADVNRLLRETYENTEWNMTKDMMITKWLKDKDGSERYMVYKSPLAHNRMTADMVDFLNCQRRDSIDKQRTVSVVWCAYSFVIQFRDWLPDAIGGVCCWSEDNPGQSHSVPLFAGQTDVSESFKVVDINAIVRMLRYRVAGEPIV